MRPDGPHDPAAQAGDDDYTIAYDLSEWEDEDVDTLEWALGREGVRNVIRGRELVVRVEDEGRVDAIIARLGTDEAELELAPAPDEGDVDLGQMEALGELYVIADRLVHQPDDPGVRGDFELAADTVDLMELPYGFEPLVWARIRAEANALTDRFDAGEDAALIGQAAARLRELLRHYV
jgi:hypothetical protein